jgi:hypothetical protein
MTSSVITKTDYEFSDWGLISNIRMEFSVLHHIQIGLESYPAYYTVGSRDKTAEAWWLLTFI